jgi:hypothetical protein
MSIAVVAVAVLVAVACPLHMWWSHRRGKPGCVPMGRRGRPDRDDVRGRQLALQRSIAEVAARLPDERRRRRQATP